MSIKDSSGFSALCDLPEIFEKKFLDFSFFERFSVEKDGFFAVSSWGKWFSCTFTLGSSYGIAYLVFFKISQLFSQVFAKHGFASVLNLCMNNLKCK